jgi:hypothetical protein
MAFEFINDGTEVAEDEAFGAISGFYSNWVSPPDTARQ